MVWYSGLNGFKSESNTYTGSSYAELIDAAGDNINHSFGNQYSSTEGIYPHNYNMGYNFYNNCFRTLWWDVNALDIINPAQFGPGDKAAGNCFTHGGVKDFICTTGNTVTYGIPNVVASECFYPDNSGDGITIHHQQTFHLLQVAVLVQYLKTNMGTSSEWNVTSKD